MLRYKLNCQDCFATQLLICDNDLLDDNERNNVVRCESCGNMIVFTVKVIYKPAVYIKPRKEMQ
jgi:transcription elongation factor Elf1